MLHVPSVARGSVALRLRQFDTDANTITVRSGVDRPSEPQHREFAVADIQAVAMSLDDLEAELWRLRRAIEKRPPFILPTGWLRAVSRAVFRWMNARIRRK
jgi:hypothetical protein